MYPVYRTPCAVANVKTFCRKPLTCLPGYVYTRAPARAWVKNLFLTYITYIWELGDIRGIPFIFEGTSG